jgi:hypothetical protein
MTSAVFSIKVFGTYVIVTGLGLMLIPNLWLAPLGLPATDEIWVRVLGLVAFVLGFYYWANALANVRSFFVASLYGRSIFCVGCIGLVVFAAAPWQIIIFGVVDLAGAAWTKLALARETPA